MCGSNGGGGGYGQGFGGGQQQQGYGGFGGYNGGNMYQPRQGMWQPPTQAYPNTAQGPAPNQFAGMQAGQPYTPTAQSGGNMYQPPMGVRKPMGPIADNIPLPYQDGQA